MVNAVDCTGLNPNQVTDLANNGVKYVGRYLSHASWKGLTLGEVANIKTAGLQIFSIYETNPTQPSYFSAAQGESDALDAVTLAKAVDQPEGTAIYFTVDYDAQAGDLESILTYFQAIKNNLVGYKVGAYGSYTVLNYLHENNAADYWFQTVAWSYGQRCSFLNIYQFQVNQTLAGVNVDFDNLVTADIGAWGKNGWVKQNNTWYYYNNDVLVKNAWAKDSKGLWYYLGDDGAMVTSRWVKYKDKWYYLGDDGAMVTNDWIKYKDKWYYLKADGSMAIGVIEDNGKLYYLDNTGAMVTSGKVNVTLNVAADGSLHP